jgi:hypothetical protein
MKRLLICLPLLATVPANAQDVTPGAGTRTVQPGSSVNVPATVGGAKSAELAAHCPAGMAVNGLRLNLGGNCSGTCGPEYDGHPVLGFDITCARIQN